MDSYEDTENLRDEGTTMSDAYLEMFANADLSTLRADLLQSGLDSRQAGEVISAFLSGRGFGVSNNEARHAATRIESVGCSIQCLREELSRLALVM